MAKVSQITNILIGTLSTRMINYYKLYLSLIKMLVNQLQFPYRLPFPISINYNFRTTQLLFDQVLEPVANWRTTIALGGTHWALGSRAPLAQLQKKPWPFRRSTEWMICWWLHRLLHWLHAHGLAQCWFQGWRLESWWILNIGHVANQTGLWEIGSTPRRSGRCPTKTFMFGVHIYIYIYTIYGQQRILSQLKETIGKWSPKK